MSEIDVSKIPADVMATAETAYDALRGIDGSFGVEPHRSADIVSIAIMILTERAACAQHAFAMRWAPPLELQGTKAATEISRLTADWSQKIGMGILNR